MSKLEISRGTFQLNLVYHGIPVGQCFYLTASGEEYLRILDHQGMERVYFGQEELPAAFRILQR
ncbi:MAG: hypothetical protein AAFP77_12630 [Bacteroidota bacterium]